MHQEISLSEKLKGEFGFVYRLIISSTGYFLISYLLIENWYDAILVRGNMKTKFQLKLRKRDISKTVTGRIVCLFARNIKDCRISGNEIIVDYRNKKALFYFPDSNQLINTITGIKEQMIEEQYKPLDFKGREVLDIGASICDSAIYFALNGARHVVALEPYPYTYAVAKRNSKINGLDKKIEVLNMACKGKSGSVVIDPDFQNNDRNVINQFKKGKRIPISTLGQLAERYNMNDAVLKIDCEGYEYEIIGNASNQTLRRFKSIGLEYHYGSKELEAKLKNAGFQVKGTIPFYMKKVDDKVNVLCGFIYAERIDTKE